MSVSISVSVAIIGALRLFRETTAQASSNEGEASYRGSKSSIGGVPDYPPAMY